MQQINLVKMCLYSKHNYHHLVKSWENYLSFYKICIEEKL